MQVETALQAAQVLVATLGVRFGEVTLQVANGEIRLARQGTTLSADDLRELAVDADRGGWV